jgi:hypothetical protein
MTSAPSQKQRQPRLTDRAAADFRVLHPTTQGKSQHDYQPVQDFCSGTQAATPTPSAANTRGSAKAGVGPASTSDVLVARSAIRRPRKSARSWTATRSQPV